jgi:hypothetical protein
MSPPVPARRRQGSRHEPRTRRFACIRADTAAIDRRARAARACRGLARHYRSRIAQARHRIAFGDAFRAELTERSLPDLSIVAGKITVSPNGRFRQRFDSDDLFLSIAQAGKSRFAVPGREALPGVGDAVLVGGCDGGIKDAYADSEFLSLRLPRKAIGSTVTNLNDSIGRRIPAGTPALRLLMHYLGVVDGHRNPDGAKPPATGRHPCLRPHRTHARRDTRRNCGG